MTNHRKGIEMKVYTTEDATTKNCCVMIKRCCGNQCMAWETIGDMGYCGMVPKTQVKDTVLVPLPDGMLTVTSCNGTIPENLVVHGLPAFDSAQETNHSNGTLHIGRGRPKKNG